MVYRMELRDRVLRTMSGSLSPRQQKVIQLRFGISEESEYTPEEVGVEFGVSASRIRQIEAKALRVLRHPKRVSEMTGDSIPIPVQQLRAVDRAARALVRAWTALANREVTR
ncbi:MAG: sigma factor-like helix-turn-helix DNA-binding protein [Gemmatimonadaceae bacterium]|jgi:DNA-directed RNA polymerase sigma subunit (sigma70/sigma32)